MRWLTLKLQRNVLINVGASMNQITSSLRLYAATSNSTHLTLTPIPSFSDSVAALCSQSTGTNSASSANPLPLPPTATASSIDYAKSIALSAKRRDDAHMKGVFERHKDVDGGLSKAAFIAALKEVEAPVLLSSDSASEDNL